MYGNPLPWKKTELTPNLGTMDSTDDVRPGMGWEGMANLQKFVRGGGVLIAVDDTANFAVQYRLHARRLDHARRSGSRLPARCCARSWWTARARLPTATRTTCRSTRPTARSSVSATPPAAAAGAVAVGKIGASPAAARRTSRISRRAARRPIRCPKSRASSPGRRHRSARSSFATASAIIPPSQRPRVVLRYGDARDLLVSGLLDGGAEIAQRPMVVDVPIEKGHVILFSNNPMWRGETHGSYFLVLNAILNHDNLDAGRRLDPR